MIALRIVLSVGIATLALEPQSVRARPIATITYSEITERADQIVIAEAIVTKDLVCEDEELPDEYQKIETTMRVHAVLKGEEQSDTIGLVHFRFASEKVRGYMSPPSPLEFVEVGKQRPFTDYSTSKGVRPHYLLFLKSRPDGRFEAVTGIWDSNESVFLLKSPRYDYDARIRIPGFPKGE